MIELLTSAFMCFVVIGFFIIGTGMLIIHVLHWIARYDERKFAKRNMNQQFEDWYKNAYGDDRELEIDKTKSDLHDRLVYANHHTQCSWLAWTASRNVANWDENV